MTCSYCGTPRLQPVTHCASCGAPWRDDRTGLARGSREHAATLLTGIHPYAQRAILDASDRIDRRVHHLRPTLRRTKWLP